MQIFLVGYMASGKSTIGRKLSARLDYRLFDTDKEIVEEEGVSVAEIFDLKGEEYFRSAENLVIKRLIESKVDSIISTGGGAPTWGDNMELMNEAGLTIYIKRSAKNIARRLSPYGRQKRPKLRGLDDKELVEYMSQGIAERDEFYSKAKLVIVADCLSDQAIIEQIIDYIRNS